MPGSRDNAKNTLFKMPFSTISRFSSLYKSSDFVRQPKNSQTFGTLNDEFCNLISSSSCQKLLNGAVPVPIFVALLERKKE
jgi:Golgi nucleoside diphosphatase